ncbi:MAG TPA: hypothetical protein VEU62_19785, partial [Bryobacterales bacterium]|nr:hypothetical protein [Bryobacterales bacterium]
NLRWIAGMLAMTALPLAAIVMFRHAPDVWSVNRYGYQSYTFWAVTLGALLDAALGRIEARRPGKGQRAALAVAAAAVYFAGHLLILERSRDDLERHVIASRAFWVGWDRAFRLAAAHRVEMGAPLAAPAIDLPAGINAQTVFELCYPRGLAGITERPGDAGTLQERREFREEILRARETLPAAMQARVLVP